MIAFFTAHQVDGRAPPAMEIPSTEPASPFITFSVDGRAPPAMEIPDGTEQVEEWARRVQNPFAGQ